MDVSDPFNSRLLTKLIRNINSEYHVQFSRDAEKSKNWKEFLKKFKEYPKVRR